MHYMDYSIRFFHFFNNGINAITWRYFSYSYMDTHKKRETQKTSE